MNSDLQSIDGIIQALYECVTVEPGAPRQWDRERTLYLPGAILVANRQGMKHFTVEEFITATDPILAGGFYEAEIGRQESRYGSMAFVTSAFEARLSKEAPLLKRGVNYILLVWKDDRWWIAGIAWDNETPELPIDWLPAR